MQKGLRVRGLASMVTLMSPIPQGTGGVRDQCKHKGWVGESDDYGEVLIVRVVSQK